MVGCQPKSTTTEPNKNMPADLYSDADPSAAPAPQTPPEDNAPEETEEAPSSPTAELPKSILGGKEFNVGDEVVLKIVQMGENSVVVEYAPEEGGEEYGETEAEPEPAQAPGSMASMME